MDTSLRLFFAINLSSRIRETLAHYLEQLKLTGAHVKWVETENLHLTLKFLGSTQPETLDGLKIEAGNASRLISPFEIFWSGFGAFPNLKKPRIIWAGVVKGAESLELLHHNLEEHLARIGIPAEERKFRAHLTIGRVKSERGLRELGKAIEKMQNNRIGQMAVNSFSLMNSTLTPKGSIYRELAAFPLGEILHKDGQNG